MNLYYAFGGGLGHLCRSNAVIHTLGLNFDDFIILSNSDFAPLVFKKNRIIKISDKYYNKPNELGHLIQLLLQEHKIFNLYIDTFPCGIIGELNLLDVGTCKIFYIARILNWDNYFPLIQAQNLRFDKTYLVEDVPEKQIEFIQTHSTSYEFVNLKYPYIQPSGFVKKRISDFKSPPWLVVHSGSFDELNELYQYALEIASFKKCNPDFLVISQTKEKLRIGKLTQINYFPASDFFPFVDKIFTACGFNSMFQTRQFAHKHYFLPFNRKFDNQYLRANQRKREMQRIC